jgi:hypothetical protein
MHEIMNLCRQLHEYPADFKILALKQKCNPVHKHFKNMEDLFKFPAIENVFIPVNKYPTSIQ